ncbi:hypothetical protein FIBSPDRAFT_1043297 [Athelia psychrophila]|uniref:Uncharacterized protein n=1 Tax=Athelia psychrophila TaxID=1759441 RepID=A0A166LH86_9AGAM|nr:hypothetical protein FIBSPDRAFT_1043297 [Fibularhizoctonia sp. CBS 109695]
MCPWEDNIHVGFVAYCGGRTDIRGSKRGPPAALLCCSLHPPSPAMADLNVLITPHPLPRTTIFGRFTHRARSPASRPIMVTLQVLFNWLPLRTFLPHLYQRRIRQWHLLLSSPLLSQEYMEGPTEARDASRAHPHAHAVHPYKPPQSYTGKGAGSAGVPAAPLAPHQRCILRGSFAWRISSRRSRPSSTTLSSSMRIATGTPKRRASILDLCIAQHPRRRVRTPRIPSFPPNDPLAARTPLRRHRFILLARLAPHPLLHLHRRVLSRLGD